ncbi:hypothetical protein [Streptomyces sp. NPDC020489]|uniref:hypothetical protein n=1 Tax=Streptomyces sp. NPDC020489 TaxID=3365077 RepID=UPI0037A68DA3
MDPPAILRPLLSRDLFDLDPVEARRVLLEAVDGPVRPEAEPPFPGTRSVLRQVGASGPRLPGSLPRVRNLPARNAAFTGRDSFLVHLRQALASDQRVAVQSLHGRGGVGKTQLAIEYAHRFAGEYELAWWIAAEDPSLIPGQFAALAGPDRRRTRRHGARCCGRAATGQARGAISLAAGLRQTFRAPSVVGVVSGSTAPTTRGSVSSPRPPTSPFRPPTQDESGSVTKTGTSVVGQANLSPESASDPLFGDVR